MNKKIIFLTFLIVVIVGIITIIFIMNNKEKNTTQSFFDIKEEYIYNTTSNTNDVNNFIDRKENMKLYIKVNNRILTATLENNSTVDELVEKLEQQEITITLEDYANFEKVGELGFDLPRNDKQITTKAGDIILYQGNKFVIYYDTNSWNFTKLGHIDNINQEELKEILGKGNVTVTLYINK